MQSFLVAANAVVPFICYMAYGYLFKKLGYGSSEFYKKLNALIFRAFFPLMMFYNLYTSKADFGSNTRLIAWCLGILTAAIVALFLIVPLIVKDERKASVVMQGIWRSNTLMFALPLSVSMYGESAGALAAIVIACVVPVYNVAAVIIFTYFDRQGHEKVHPLTLLKNIITNPLIAGAIVGALFRLLGITLPSAILSPIGAFSSMTTPLSIFVLGAALEIPAIGKNIRLITGTLVCKLLVMPAIVIVIGFALGFRQLDLFLLFIMFAAPIATASYPMAQNMGGDGELAGQLLAISTVCSLFTIFFWITLLHGMGIF